MGFDLPERRAIARRMRDARAREQQVNVEFERCLGAKFRARRAAFEAVIAGEIDAVARAAFDKRSARLAGIAEKLREVDAAGALTVQLDGLAESFVHMHANRMLRADLRAQELVLYDVLERLYAGQVARDSGRLSQ